MTTSDSNVYGGGWIRDSTLVNNIRKAGRDIKYYSTFCKVYSDEAVRCDGLYFKLRDVLLAHNVPKYYDLPAFPEFESPFRNVSYAEKLSLGKFSMDSFNLERFSKKIRSNFDMLVFQFIPRDVKEKKEYEILRSLEFGADGKLRREVMSFENRLKKDNIRLLNTTSLLWSKVSSDIKENLGIIDVATIQGYDMIYSVYKDEYKKEIESLLRENVKNTDGFIGISEYYSRKASSDLKIPLKKINVIYNGINLEKYRPVDVKRDKRFIITFLGRMDIKKGGLNLIVAAKHLIDAGYTNFSVNIVGSIDRRDSEYIAILQNYISLFKLSNVIEIKTDVTLDEKINILNKSDVLVYPTLFPEPFGLVPIEAMACGTPVILPDHGAFPEIIRETKGGLLFRSNDTYDLAKKIIILMESEDKRMELSKDGLEAVRQKFGAKLMADKVLKVYDDMLD
ncbi:MAG: glycosyltransferase family 4 protein [archaeon]|nr:glycosyltransferase family 4 protein [archaeon]